MKKIRDVVPMHNDQLLAFWSFEVTILADVVAKWRATVELWERDANAPNPFKAEKWYKDNLFPLFLHDDDMAFASYFGAFGLRKAGRRGWRVWIGCECKHRHFVWWRSPICGHFERTSSWGRSELISQCMDTYWLKLLRQCLAEDFKTLGLHPTSKQIATLAEHSNHLCHCIAKWIEVQECYMPEACVSRQLDAEAQPEGVTSHKPQDILLHLLSSYKFWIPLQWPELRMYKLRLQEGWAHDALHEMHQHLWVHTHLYKQKDKYAQGICYNTRANSVISKCQAKVDRATVKYHTSCEAMLSLLNRGKQDLTQHTQAQRHFVMLCRWSPIKIICRSLPPREFWNSKGSTGKVPLKFGVY
jgi:hypothetical protein